MTDAVFGLVGVMLGGVLTGTVTYLLERQRERKRVRAASRLLFDALWDAYLTGQSLLMDGTWPGTNPPLNYGVWEEHRDLMGYSPFRRGMAGGTRLVS